MTATIGWLPSILGNKRQWRSGTAADKVFSCLHVITDFLFPFFGSSFIFCLPAFSLGGLLTLFFFFFLIFGLVYFAWSVVHYSKRLSCLIIRTDKRIPR